VLTTIIGSSVVAALVTGILSWIAKRIDQRRDDQIRHDEREQSRLDKAADYDAADRRERAARELVRLNDRKEAARAQARILLPHLEALSAEFDAQGSLARSRTYSYDKELYSPITSTTRLIPDAEFREYIDLAMQVIKELWVPASVGEGPEEPHYEQRKILANAMTQVGRVITDDGWDKTAVIELRSMKDLIDEAWQMYHER
jgi:hypothetical protein